MVVISVKRLLSTEVQQALILLDSKVVMMYLRSDVLKE